MDVQLQELIEKIKKDGVAAAESNAQAIIADAEKKAQSIIADAEAKAAAMVKTAKAETERMEKTSIDAVSQAGRNLLIFFRDGVINALSALVKKETAKAYNADMLKSLIPETVKSWIKNTNASSLSVLLSAKDLEQLESSFAASLKAEIAAGLVIRSDDNISAGFRIGIEDGAAFYDFSADAVADMFAGYLNPKTAAVLKDAAAALASEGKK